MNAAAVAQRKPWVLGWYMLRNPAQVPALLANLRAKAIVPPPSFAAVRYYPIHAYRWIAEDGSSRWVRYTWLPEATQTVGGTDGGDKNGADKDGGAREYLQQEFAARLAAGPVRFTLEVQVAADDDEPHDPTSVWRNQRVVRVGTLEINAPAADPEAGGRVVVFDPTRVIDGIELSDDPILHSRIGAYAESVRRRTSSA
jgi:catalase